MPREIRDRKPKERQKRELGRPDEAGWEKQEKRLAEESGGRRTRGSGAGNDKGDVHFGADLLVEAKYTDKMSFRLDQKLLVKVTKEARGKNKTPALAVEFGNMPLGTERDWIMVPKSVLLDNTD